MKIQILRLAATTMFATLSFSQSASAAVTVTDVVDGKCTSVTAANGCLFKGNINTSANGNNSYLNAQNAYNLYNDTHASAAPDIFLTPLAASDAEGFGSLGSITGADIGVGNWSLNGLLASYVGVKAGSNFVLYALGSPSSSGTWNTSDLPTQGNGDKELSHLVFFGNAAPVSAVPEASTWAMMILGFGFVGFAMRRRKTTHGMTPALAA